MSSMIQLGGQSFQYEASKPWGDGFEGQKPCQLTPERPLQVGNWLSQYTEALLEFLDHEAGCTLITNLELSVGGPFKQYVCPNIAVNWHFAGGRLGLIGNPQFILNRGPSQYRYAPNNAHLAAQASTDQGEWITSTVHWGLSPNTLFVFKDKDGPHRGMKGPDEIGNWLLSGYVM